MNRVGFSIALLLTISVLIVSYYFDNKMRDYGYPLEELFSCIWIIVGIILIGITIVLLYMPFWYGIWYPEEVMQYLNVK